MIEHKATARYAPNLSAKSANMFAVGSGGFSGFETWPFGCNGSGGLAETAGFASGIGVTLFFVLPQAVEGVLSSWLFTVRCSLVDS